MIRVFLVEDHTAIREMMADVLRAMGGYSIVGETGDGGDAAKKILQVKPDLVLLDARLPGRHGLEVLRACKEKMPSIRFLVFSGYETPQLIREMLRHGADGFIDKTSGLDELMRGIQTVSEGRKHLSPGVQKLLEESQAPTGLFFEGPETLTEREKEVLQLIAEGLSTKEIAQLFKLSVKTVDNHRTNLMRKLDIHNVANLTRFAIENGYAGGLKS